MGKPINFKGVIKPVKLEENFVIVARAFAQDDHISAFTKAVILDIQSRSENWETNCGTIMKNKKVGRNKAQSVLSEGMKAGYIYAHRPRTDKGTLENVTYHISTCVNSLRSFVVEKGWETEESYDLKHQGLKIQGVDNHEPKIGGVVETDDYIQNGITPLSSGHEPANQDPVNQGLDLRGNKRKEGNKKKNKQKASRAGISFCSQPEPKDLSLTDFDAFLSSYEQTLVAAARTARIEGIASARATWVRLSEDDKVACRGALPRYGERLKADGWRAPQSISSFLRNGWRDFVPSAADKAREKAKAEELQVMALAIDINRNQFDQARKWWPKMEDVPQSIIAKAREYARVEFGYEPRAA
jgi:hypothetical protein